MRIIFALLCLLVSGCAVNDHSHLIGSAAKHDSSMLVARYGTFTTQDAPTKLQCRGKQVQWCGDSRNPNECRCVFLYKDQEPGGRAFNRHRPR